MKKKKSNINRAFDCLDVIPRNGSTEPYIYIYIYNMHISYIADHSHESISHREFIKHKNKRVNRLLNRLFNTVEIKK